MTAATMKAAFDNAQKADDMRAAAEFLVDAGWLLPAPVRDGGTIGRASLDYNVNPAVLETGQ